MPAAVTYCQRIGTLPLCPPRTLGRERTAFCANDDKGGSASWQDRTCWSDRSVVSLSRQAVIVNRVLETVHISAHVIDAMLAQEMLNASVERLPDLVSGKRLSIVFELGFQQSIEHWRPHQSSRLSNLGVTKRTPRQFPPIHVVSRWPFSPYSPAPSCMKACKNTSASRRDGNERNASIFPVGLNTAATNGNPSSGGS
jgi:hypothetical protein